MGYNLHIVNPTELHRNNNMLVNMYKHKYTSKNITMTIILQLQLTWNYFEYVSVRELYNKYCFNNDLIFEIGISKTIILCETFHIRVLTVTAPAVRRRR